MKQKLLFVITKSNYGGAQRYVHELARAYKDTYDVVVAFGGHGVLKEKLATDGIRTIEITGFLRDINILKELRLFKELWRLYRTERPDIIHLNSSKAAAIGAFVGRICGIPRIVSTIHGWPFLEERPFLWRSIVWLGCWLSVLLAHRVILVSKYDKQRPMPLLSHKCTVIHTAVPTILFRDRLDARNALFDTKTLEDHISDIWITTNAELNPNKNLFTAIDAVTAYNETRDQKIFYSIVSDGELKERLAAYINSKNAATHITLLGYVDNARVYLKAFDIFLLPSKKEGLPYAILEAGAAGLPVIASRVGGIPEIIDNKQDGLLIDPQNASSIEEAFETLVDNRELGTQYGLNLKVKIERDFSLTHMIEATKKLYENH